MHFDSDYSSLVFINSTLKFICYFVLKVQQGPLVSFLIPMLGSRVLLSVEHKTYDSQLGVLENCSDMTPEEAKA